MSLWLYAERNDVVKLKRLLILRRTFPVDALNHLSQSALFVACERGHSEIAELLLTRGASVNHGAKPLIAAVRNGHETCVQLLLRSGANANCEDINGRSAFLIACKNQHINVVKLLLNSIAEHLTAESADNNIFNTEFDSRKLLGVAVENLDYHLIKLLVGYGANINATDSQGHTPLHQVLTVRTFVKVDRIHTYARLKLVTTKLLESGACVNGYSANKTTPLFLACLRKDPNCTLVKLLLSNGADPNLRCSHAARNGQLNTLKYPLSHAVSSRNMELSRLLLQNGAQPDNFEYRRKTALHLAVENFVRRDLSFVKLLLEFGASVNLADDRGLTVLYKACSVGCTSVNLQLVTYLLGHGANPNRTAACRNKLDAACGRSSSLPLGVPLLEAVIRHHATLTDILLKNGADVNNKNHQGLTVLHLISSHRGECAQTCLDILLEHKADVNVLCANQESPMSFACKAVVVKTVKKLLCKSPCRAVIKRSVELACAHNKVEILKLLLDYGVDLDDEYWIQHAEKRRVEPTGLMPLFLAAELGHIDIVRCLLDAGVSVNRADCLVGNTVLHTVINEMFSSQPDSRQEALLDLLLERGADCNISNNMGVTALAKAVCRRLGEVVSKLLKHGGNPNQMCAAKRSMLAVACRRSDIGMAAALLAAGADPNLCDSKPLTVAALTLNAPLVQLLVDNGARLTAAVTCNAELVQQLVNNSIKLDRWEQFESCEQRSPDQHFTLSQFFMSVQRDYEYIMQLFKAGSTLSLLSVCCAVESAPRTERCTLSIRLCQAIVLSGYHVTNEDISELVQSKNSHSCQLLSDCHGFKVTWLIRRV